MGGGGVAGGGGGGGLVKVECPHTQTPCITPQPRPPPPPLASLQTTASSGVSGERALAEVLHTTQELFGAIGDEMDRAVAAELGERCRQLHNCRQFTGEGGGRAYGGAAPVL